MNIKALRRRHPPDARAPGRRIWAYRADVGPWSIRSVFDPQSQSGSGMASSHPLQTLQIKSNDRLLSVGNHRHAQLPGAAHDVPRRLAILGDIDFSKLHGLLAKELLRSVAPGSSRCAVDDDRVCTDGHVVYLRNAPMPPPASSRR